LSDLFIVWQARRFHALIVHDFYAFDNPTVLCLSSHDLRCDQAVQIQSWAAER
jgi:hypothetical protein